MTAERRYRLVNTLGHGIAVASAVVLITIALLWQYSRRAAVSFELTGPGAAELQFTSLDGRILFGVFQPDPKVRKGWWRPPRAGIPDLVLDDQRHFVGDMYGWGFAVPHYLVAAMAFVPIAWWLLVFTARQEHHRRVQHGLCLTCGYDISHSSHRCPECGTPCGNASVIALA